MPGSQTKQITVLLVDDHEVVRVGLRTLLSRDTDIRVVGEAGSAKDAVDKVARLKPEVALLDIRIPDHEGINACTEIHEVSPDTKVLFLTSYADDDTVLAAILAGAQGYLLKEIEAETLLRAIRIVASGHSILDPVVTKRALEWLKGMSAPSPGSKLESLSPQEQAVVSHVAEGKTNKEIATALGLSEKTVKNYLANVYQKLNISRRSQAAVFFAKRQPE